ncbi:hypothetical protein BN1079_03460 [Pseudomonas saudiphocaensis]|uniref:Uncharacterized protein n=1 Tax=Pseudomonas saudiphocaensis TaxID=1499686 RepID=A0A078LXW3_9PSED|nr:hypothetical protein BN1079_03460 [Pseudomonas saudiphocaensis]
MQLPTPATPTTKPCKSLICKGYQNLARQVLYIWHNNNNKQTHNKNKTYRLQQNNDKKAEA